MAPVLFKSVAVGRRSHEGDVPVFVFVHGDAHDALELGREWMQDVRQRSVEVVFAVIQRLTAVIKQ